MKKVTKIRTWGNSLGLRLPKSLVNALRLQDGSTVEIIEMEGKIINQPQEQSSFTLEELLVGMDQEGVMDQYISKTPTGKERFWEEDKLK